MLKALCRLFRLVSHRINYDFTSAMFYNRAEKLRSSRKGEFSMKRVLMALVLGLGAALIPVAARQAPAQAPAQAPPQTNVPTGTPEGVARMQNPQLDRVSDAADNGRAAD